MRCRNYTPRALRGAIWGGSSLSQPIDYSTGPQATPGRVDSRPAAIVAGHENPPFRAARHRRARLRLACSWGGAKRPTDAAATDPGCELLAGDSGPPPAPANGCSDCRPDRVRIPRGAARPRARVERAVAGSVTE